MYVRQSYDYIGYAFIFIPAGADPEGVVWGGAHTLDGGGGHTHWWGGHSDFGSI